METTFLALFDDTRAAQEATDALVEAGVARSAIKVLGNHIGAGEGLWYAAPQRGDAADGPVYFEGRRWQTGGAIVGAILGAIAGLGTGMLTTLDAWPGPVVGPAWLIVCALLGLGAGAAVVGVLGALIDRRRSLAHAPRHAEGLHRGGTLLAVWADGPRVRLAGDVLQRCKPADVENVGLT